MGNRQSSKNKIFTEFRAYVLWRWVPSPPGCHVSRNRQGATTRPKIHVQRLKFIFQIWIIIPVESVSVPLRHCDLIDMSDLSIMWGSLNPLLRVKTVSPCRRSCYIPTGDILVLDSPKNTVFELRSWLIDLLGVKWFNRERHRRKEGEDRWREFEEREADSSPL